MENNKFIVSEGRSGKAAESGVGKKDEWNEGDEGWNGTYKRGTYSKGGSEHDEILTICYMQ
jgi:hypothetical protein